MAPRLLHALVFFPDIVAAEIFRADQFEDKKGLHLTDDIGKKRNVLVSERNGQKTELTPVEGTILAVGQKTVLSKMVVTEEGKLGTNNDIGIKNRYQVLLFRSNARNRHLAQIDQTLTSEGPGALILPKPRVYKSKGPRTYNTAAQQLLQTRVDNLPCFTKTADTVELALNAGVYLTPYQICLINTYCKDSQANMFRSILRQAIPKDILLSGGLSVAGKRGCVKIPEKLIVVAKAYAETHATAGKVPLHALRSTANFLQQCFAEQNNIITPEQENREENVANQEGNIIITPEQENREENAVNQEGNNIVAPV